MVTSVCVLTRFHDSELSEETLSCGPCQRYRADRFAIVAIYKKQRRRLKSKRTKRCLIESWIHLQSIQSERDREREREFGSVTKRRISIPSSLCNNLLRGLCSMARSRVLIIGATGYLGRHITQASVNSGHPTYALIRPSQRPNPERTQLIESFKRSNVQIVEGSIEDRLTLSLALERVDIVISVLGTAQLMKQVDLVKAIQQVGTIKRFVPSEFGIDVDRITRVPALQTLLEGKAETRRAIEAAGIPYTYISSNCLASSFLAGLLQPGLNHPPRDKVVIYGNGNVKGIYVDEPDVAAFTIKAIEDPRTLNKSLYIRPPGNTLSQNEMVSMWEEKICRTLEKLSMTEVEMKTWLEDAPYPISAVLGLIYIVCFKGDTSNFEIGPDSFEACTLYPEVHYTTATDYFDRFL